MTQNASARLISQLQEMEKPASEAASTSDAPATPQPSLADTQAPRTAEESASEGFAAQESPSTESGHALSYNKRPLVWALVATLFWLAVITGGFIALGRAGKFAAIDATTVAAYAAGIFTPITAFWLMALAMLRGGVLSSEQERTEKAIGDLVTPIDAARARAEQLAAALEAQIMRMTAAADAAEAKAASLDAAAQREADKLLAAGEAMEAFQAHVEKVVTRLQDLMANTQGLIGRLEAVLPDTAKRLSSAVSEAALQSEALTAASVKIADASSAARKATDDALPGFQSVVAKLEEASDKIAERLSLLEIQAAAASRAMDSSAEKASEALESSRTWVEQQIATIDSSVARVESDVVQRLEALTLSLGEASSHMERELPMLIEKMNHQLLGIENSMKARMEEISSSFTATVDAWENASMASSVQLIDAMARARSMSNEATNAARDATAGIVASIEAALQKATQGAQSTVSAGLDQLRAQSEQIAQLAEQAEERNNAVRAALEEKVHQDFARTADQIIDRLHAYAVDISKLYSGNVTEQELRAYLKGDRTLFARRFARHIPGLGQQQDGQKIIEQIAERLAAEPEFADITRRYLTAFEALLKLGQHRGEQDALTVSLLTSDLGKIYLALARAAGRMN